MANKNIKKVILCLLYVLYCSSTYSQIVLRGIIKDSTESPMAFAPLAVLKLSDSSIVVSATSDESGHFLVNNIIPGNYLIKVNSVGYREYYSPILSIEQKPDTIVLKDIILKTNGINLNEVAVVAIQESIEIKDGNFVLNVENNPLATGSTVLDLLKRMPGVFIDNQNNISINGRGGVRILIDGKIQRLSGQQLISVLQSMSSESISKIELLKNPPVKYDSEGSSGMINIITKKVRLMGASGFVSANGSKGTMYRWGTDAALNYKTKKITLFSNIGYSNRAFYSEYIFNRSVTNNGNTTNFNELGVQINYQEVLYFKIGADYTINDRLTIGFLTNGGPSSMPMTDIGVNQISGYNNVGFDHSDFNVKADDKWVNPGYNINAEYKIDTLGSTLNFSADYSYFLGNRSALSTNLFLDTNDAEALASNIFISTSKTKIDIYTQKIDFRKQMRNKVLIEAGLKNTMVYSNNNFMFERENKQTKVFETDSSASNNYFYYENIIAGYINVKKEFEHATFQLGVRGENTIVDARTSNSVFKLSRNYFLFFPSLIFDYSKSKTHSISFNINRRIDRPSYKDLNPYKSYQDNYSATVGNPNLLPQTSFNFSFSYIYKQFMYNTFTYTLFDKYMLSVDLREDSTMESTSSIRNINSCNYFSYNLFLRKKIMKQWSSSLSINTYYQNYQATINGNKLNSGALAFNITNSHDVILPKNFKCQVNFQYSGPSVYGITYVKSRWTLDLALKKSFFENKLNINLSFFDIFYTNITNIKNEFASQSYTYYNPLDTRRVGLSLVYRFGKIKIQKRQVNSNDQEKNRYDEKTRK